MSIENKIGQFQSDSVNKNAITVVQHGFYAGSGLLGQLAEVVMEIEALNLELGFQECEKTFGRLKKARREMFCIMKQIESAGLELEAMRNKATAQAQTI